MSTVGGESKLGEVCEALLRYPEARAWFNLAFTSNPASETRAGLTRLAHQDADPQRDPGC